MESQIHRLIPYLVAMDDDYIQETLRKSTAVMNKARETELQGGNVLVEFIKGFVVPSTNDDFLYVGIKDVVGGIPGGIQ